MSTWTKCDRCGALGSPLAMRDWDTIRRESDNGKPCDLCASCRQLLTDFMLTTLGTADVWHNGTKSGYRAVLLQKLTPEEFAGPDFEASDPVFDYKPVLSIEEMTKALAQAGYLVSAQPGELPLMILPPGPPIHIPNELRPGIVRSDEELCKTVTVEPRLTCGGDDIGRACGHMVSSHSDSGCMVKVNGEYCKCGKRDYNPPSHDWTYSAQAESTEAEVVPAIPTF